ncbi:MAG: DUF2723 domain-containing protein [Flavobacteriales bacterium]|nr:DUF2723 domain-containing protein [Flavobacteriales bacterium]MCX7651172.1 DUF2723 domain-containing protein [Flavobacteriales bacterium]MDW8431649.1 DUF2723 domain-containing protein [Flavobacteriales bacterium]
MNNLLGWLCFLVAFFTYFATMEPTVSFWDCGEFIASSYKLQVGHPPGAPLFMVIGRIFSFLAGGDVGRVAYWINMVSVLSSALTIAFLFWTITILGRKLAELENSFLARQDARTRDILIFGSALVGALAYTFTDTFWFSAVEAEVYATSSLFTAIVFWAMLRWDLEADNPSARRWIVFIAYLMGLSIGIHLLNLLTIPALAFIYYFRRYKTTFLGVVATLFLGFYFLLFVQYGVIPGIVRGAADLDRFVVNTLGLPFYTGLALYFIILVGIVGLTLHFSARSSALPLWIFPMLSFTVFHILTGKMWFSLAGAGIWYVLYRLFGHPWRAFITTATGFVPGLLLWSGIYKDKSLDKFSSHPAHGAQGSLNLLVTCFAVILVGYTSYALIIIRSNANPPMDENNPADPYSLLSYLNREQYGQQPLFYGPYYDAEYDSREPYKDDGPVYARAFMVQDGTGKTLKWFTTAEDARDYLKKNNLSNARIVGKYLEVDRKQKPNYARKDMTIFPRMWSPESRHEAEYKYWGQVAQGKKPTFLNNLIFFFRYHINFMYVRYFMWNFSGRQNDIQGNGEPHQGNWISGIPFVDRYLAGAGPQSQLPDTLRTNPGRNRYYLLPLLLGILGLSFHYQQDKRNAIIVFMLFFLTGLAIVLYLNQTPLQPRERDYAYAGSFYAFCIWVGLGVMGLFEWLNRYVKQVSGPALAAGVTMVSLLAAPALLAKENWDDHDRSGRYTARDFAYNYLNSCAKDAILFTNGDNDTFPLWYLQEVEGVRTDVRIVNLSLLNTDWYIDQMKRAAYDGKPVPFDMPQECYLASKRDQVLLDRSNPNFYTIQDHFAFLNCEGENCRNQVPIGNGSQKLYYFKSNKFIVPVDSAEVASNGTVSPENRHRIEKELRLVIDRPYILKSDLMILNLISAFGWKRPVYFAITIGDKFLGLENYLQLEGLAYRLVPYRVKPHDNQTGEVNAPIMFDNLMNKFRWGNMNDPKVYLDETNQRMTYNFRNNFVRLASQLLRDGDKDKAAQVLDRAEELMPDSRVPYNYFNLLMADLYLKLGQKDKALQMLDRLKLRMEQDIAYFNQFTGGLARSVQEDRRRAEYILQACQELSGALRLNLPTDEADSSEMP